ncbi:TPA: hypothetical protein ACH3X1_001467 [Trebouxia sp. C0004]
MSEQPQEQKKRVVGFAILPDKARKHITGDLLKAAATANIEILAIDPSKPVAEQGNFDLILQKCRDAGWRQRLLHYLQHHPRTRLIDTFEAVQSLMARDSMLQPLADPVTLHPPINDRLSPETAERDVFSCAAPVQAALQEGCSEADMVQLLNHTQMCFPLLAKPYFTDGRQGSHGLALVHSLEGLERLVKGTGPPGVALPVMLQPFIEHGGCLFKVYVIGCSIVVVHRPSLQVPPEDEDITAQRKGIQIMTRVSAFNSKSPMGCDFVEGPPDWLLDQLAATLRSRLHLQLFNFDLVRPTEHNAPGSKGADFLVVDINYFPGYEKLPNHADLMVGFLQSQLDPEQDQRPVLRRHLSSCLEPPDNASDSE